MTDKLRTPDLIAKIARVTLKDTIRVLIAADLAAWYQGKTFEELLADASDPRFSAGRPDPENVAACEQAFFGLNEDLKRDAGMKRWMKELENFR